MAIAPSLARDYLTRVIPGVDSIHTDADTHRRYTLGYPVVDAAQKTSFERRIVSTKINAYVLITADVLGVRVVI